MNIKSKIKKVWDEHKGEILFLGGILTTGLIYGVGYSMGHSMGALEGSAEAYSSIVTKIDDVMAARNEGFEMGQECVERIIDGVCVEHPEAIEWFENYYPGD